MADLSRNERICGRIMLLFEKWKEESANADSSFIFENSTYKLLSHPESISQMRLL